ncbi:MAG: PQQ-binding-like beta-propeller repeat protein [Candidatus Bathyarchaeota archaeon]|nr:PQQ-binding-like beta-propeller repeat protein [Candidatus Bathyarchaeota archaeon]
MEKSKHKLFRATGALLIVLLLSFIPTIFLDSETAPAIVNAADYGDIMQYDWPQGGYDEGNSGFNPGPAPDRPNILWSAEVSGSGMVSVFNGKAYMIQGIQISGTAGASVVAFDALTGQKVWTANVSKPFRGVSGVQKLNDDYLLGYDNGFLAAIKTDDGTTAWEMDIPNGSGIPGSGSYFAGHYSDSLKIFACASWDPVTNEAKFLGFDLSDPSTVPTIAWTYLTDSPAEMLCSGDGKFYLGTTEATVVAINGENGERMWETSSKGGLVQQSAIYQDGNLYTSAVTWQMTCIDTATGEIKWQAEKGARAFSAYRGAAGLGMVFDATVELDPHGTIRAWDVETGEELWRQPAYFNIHYATMAVADGKLYSSTCDQPASGQTGGLQMPGYETACFDAYTGTQLWKLQGINFAHISIAYGNVYGFYGNRLYCIGGEPADWTNGLQGTVENGRVAVGQSGPSDISTPRWTFTTGGDVSSSPAVVDGKVYVGSHDKNWYCLDAYTGEKIWTFTAEHFVRSSAAISGGRVFTGADDGYFYCLDADTGTQIWKTSAGGHFPNTFTAIEYQSRSSPIVVGNKVYVGSLDGKVYCLDTAEGNVLATYDTGSPIFGSPAYADGTVYIASTDFFLYALNANDLTLKWKSISLTMDVAVPDRSKFTTDGTPVIGGGLVYMGAGVYSGTAKPGVDYAAAGHSLPSGGWGGTMRMMAFDARTGESVWNVTRAGNTPLHVPVYWQGSLYEPEFFYIVRADATNPNSGDVELGDFGRGDPRLAGNRTWAQWLGYQISSSAAYADDPTGPKVYIGSDIGSLYALDANTGETLSVFTAGANIPSSPTVWDGKLYACAVNGNVYCFDDSPTVDFSINAASSKGDAMWASETVTIGGRLVSKPQELVWTDDSVYVATPSNMNPGLPDADVIVSFTKPDGTSLNLTATTDKAGYFSVSYTPTDVGAWGWVAYYEGKCTTGLTYNEAYSEYAGLTVDAPPNGNTQTAAPQTTAPTSVAPTAAEPTSTPADDAFPMEYIYAVIAVIVVVIVVVAAYLYFKQKK